MKCWVRWCDTEAIESNLCEEHRERYGEWQRKAEVLKSMLVATEKLLEASPTSERNEKPDPLYCTVAPDGDRFVLREVNHSRDATVREWEYSGVVCWDGAVGSVHPHATFATRAEAVSFAMAHNIDLAAG